MFADDTVFVARIHHDTQEIITLFAQATNAFRLKSNIKNRGCISTCTRLSWWRWSHLTIWPWGHSGSKDKHLSSIISNNNEIYNEHKIRTTNTSKVFERFKVRVWNNTDLSIKTKCAVYKAIVLLTLPYGSIRPGLSTMCIYIFEFL